MKKSEVPFSADNWVPELRTLTVTDWREAFAASSPSPVIACTASEDMARQEYKLQSDLQYQVTRFGAGLPFKSGEVNWDNMDLTRAFELIAESRDAWLRLPRVVRDRYQSWDNVERAASSGELLQVLKAAGIAAEEVPAAVSAASPSVSAADGASGGSTAS